MSNYWDVLATQALTIPTPLGANDTVLTADSAQPTGLKWATPAGGGGGVSPTGSVMMFAGSAAPSGYLLCDGSAVSRSTYAALFTAIGTAYGAGDGSTTFNLPDLQGRLPVGLGTHADVNALGKSDGIATVGNRRPAHKHSAAVGTLATGTDSPDHSHGIGLSTQSSAANAGLQRGPVENYNGVSAGASARHTHAVTGAPTVGPQTGAEPTDAPAYVVLNYIIKT